MTLTGASWPQFDHVVIALDKRNRAEQGHTPRPLIEATRLQTYRTQQQINPLSRIEGSTPCEEHVKSIRLGHLNWSQRRIDLEWSAPVLLRNAACVCECYLRVET